MTRLLAQDETPILSAHLRPRLEALGLTVLSISAQGGVDVVCGDHWLHRVIAQSTIFAGALLHKTDDLASGFGNIIELWPELWIAPLPGPRRRRAAEARFRRASAVVLLVGRGFVESDEMRAICSTGQLDYAAVLARVKDEELTNCAEANRLAAMLYWMQQDTHEIDRRSSELCTLSGELGESYEELSLLYKLTTGMTLDRPPAQFLTEACHDLQQVVGLRWVALQLVDDQPALGELAGEVFIAGPVGCDDSSLKRIGRMLMLRQKPGMPPLVVDDTHALQIPNLPRLAGRLLVVSLMREDKPLGILFGGDKIDGSHISSIDSKLCNSLAASLSMFLENMMLYEDMASMFMGVLHALTSSIDAKDRYTLGHSERVAMLSRQLAAAAGLDAHTVERVYLAGLVHDVGKIGVPESVLCKPGRLTEQEFALIRMHPEIGARILQDIRQMQDLVPGVMYHHERWDGRGYPHGLKGEDIPMFGRLICLADSFDAMSSTRTYRAPLSHRSVLDEIGSCAGTQFDPALAEAFLTLDFDPFHEMIRKHHPQIQSRQD